MFNRRFTMVPVYRRRSFDDAIMECPRVRKAVKGHARELNMKRFDVGHGDFESCCRAVTMLCELWTEAPSQWFPRAVIAVSRICGGLSAHDGLSSALSRTYDVEYLDGGINPPNLIAWAAVCAAKGGTSFDCCSVFDSAQARNLIIGVFKNFDRLDITRYSDTQLQKIMQGR